MAPNESAVNQEQTEDSKVPKWVTQEYFENICSREIEDFSKISKFVAEPGSGAGENYASIILRVLIECELKDGSKKDFSLMVKAAHPKDSQAGQMVEEMNIFGKENEVYNNIIPAFEQLYLKKGKKVVFGPKSFTFDKDPGVETVVLEDLRPRNFKNVNRLEGLDMDHIKSVLVKLAEYHAASATYFEDIKSIPEKMLKGMLDPEKKELIKPFYELNNPYIIKALTENMDNGEYYAKKMVTDADTMIEHDIKHLGSFDPEEFNVLNHGDCWANNIMFRHNEEGKLEETLLIDFQMCKWGSPAQDLFYFLFTSAKLDLKLKHFDYFIKFYHEKLVENLKLLGYSKPIPSLMELHILLFKNQSWGIFAAIGVMSVVLLDPTEEASMDNFLSDSAGGKSFREKLYSTKRFIKAMNDILPWMDNRGALVF